MNAGGRNFVSRGIEPVGYHHSAVIGQAQATPVDLAIWTKMHTNAGQSPESIVAAKEAERQAGEGTFVWAIGTRPPKALMPALMKAASLPVLFSLMLSRPQRDHIDPQTVVRWKSYIDQDGTAKPLPAHMVPTGRLTERAHHYALFCLSEEPLEIGNLGPFDPKAWRNVGSGRQIGGSQVTTLVERHSPDGDTPYSIAMRARLIGWVKLVDPAPYTADESKLHEVSRNVS
jgi:hypothetical protein